MGISISVIFLFASLIVFWIVPAIGIAKNHLVDDRFFIRQWLFPMQYWLQLLFERISGNRRIVVRILQIMSLFITYFGGLLMLMIFSVFDGNLLRTCLVSFKNYLQEGQYNHLKTAVKGTFTVFPKSPTFV